MAVRRFGVTFFLFSVTLGATPLRPTTHQKFLAMCNSKTVILDFTTLGMWVGETRDGKRFAGKNFDVVSRLVYAAGYVPYLRIPDKRKN